MEKIQTRTIILEICIVLVKAVTLGNQSTIYINTTRKQRKVNQEPSSLALPYLGQILNNCGALSLLDSMTWNRNIYLIPKFV